MGRIEVNRWEWLKILIWKHMWIKEIGLLQLIIATNALHNFFGHPVVPSGLYLTFLICRCLATPLLKRSTGDSPPELTSRSEVTAKTDKIFKCQIHTECLISKQIYSFLGSISKRASFTLLRKPSCTKIDNFSVVVQPTPKTGKFWREKILLSHSGFPLRWWFHNDNPHHWHHCDV